MGILSCFAAPRSDDMLQTPAKYSSKKSTVINCSTQTDVPDASWLKEALAASSHSLSTNETSGLPHDSLNVSALRSPHSFSKPGSIHDPLSASRMSATLHEVPSSLPSQDTSNGETLLVTSAAGVDECEATMKAELKKVFLEFAQFGTRSEAKTMDVYRFTKLCRECDLLAQPQDASSINLIFYKCKGSKASKITFGQFKLALKIIAEYLNWDITAVHARIANSDGPVVHNITLPKYVRLHDTPTVGGTPNSSRNPSFTGGIARSPSFMDATPVKRMMTSTAAAKHSITSNSLDLRSTTAPGNAWR